MKKNIVNITSELVYVENSNELYQMDLGAFVQKDFDTEDYDNNEVNVHDTNPKNLPAYFRDEVNLIPIEEIKSAIQSAEDKGANYVQVFYHGDHREYEVYGLNIHPESSKEKKIRIKQEGEFKLAQQEAVKMKIKNYAKEHGLTVTIE